jgi:hypothetical protein
MVGKNPSRTNILKKKAEIPFLVKYDEFSADSLLNTPKQTKSEILSKSENYQV